MTHENIDNLLAAVLSLIEMVNTEDSVSKAALLKQAKLIVFLKAQTYNEVLTVDPDSRDELTLAFGEKFFNLLEVK